MVLVKICLENVIGTGMRKLTIPYFFYPKHTFTYSSLRNMTLLVRILSAQYMHSVSSCITFSEKKTVSLTREQEHFILLKKKQEYRTACNLHNTTKVETVKATVKPTT